MRAAAGLLLLLGLATAATNLWVVGALNRRVLPQAAAQAAAALERKVRGAPSLYSFAKQPPLPAA